MKKIYIIALILALIAGVAVYMFASSLEQQAKPAEIPTTTIVMAATDIPEGVYITADMLKLSAVPTKYVQSGALTDPKGAIGMVNKYKCLANTQITSQQLGSPADAKITEGGKLSYAIADGMRAITIAVNDVTGVAGFIAEGDKVDIVLLANLETGKKDIDGNPLTDTTALYLLENVKVIRIGSLTQNVSSEAASTVTLEDGSKKEVTPPPVEYVLVTFEVTPEDALYLSLYESMGTLRLMLRNIEDDSTSEGIIWQGDGVRN